MVLIGICGKKLCGKDTIGNYLEEIYGYKKLHIAYPLKKICKEIFGFQDDQLFGNKKEDIDPRWNVTPRQCFQFVGTFFRENMKELIPDLKSGFWVHRFEHEYVLMKQMYRNIVICDVRYQDEIDMIISLGGYIINVERDTNIEDEHQSENQELTGITMNICNNKTMSHLLFQVDELMTKIAHS